MLILQDVTVVELASGVAGPLATLRLGDLGADVIKVERAPGDWLRAAAPEAPGSSDSAAFVALNRGKRSVALGEQLTAAQPLLLRLIRRADVVVSDWSTEVLETCGLLSLYEDSAAGRSSQIWVRLSDFGERGPLSGRKGSELVVQALAGYTRYLGEQGKPANRLVADVSGAATGVFTAHAVLAALFRLRKSGTAQAVTVSRLNSLLSMKSIQLAAQSDPDDHQGPCVGGAHYPPESGWMTADKPITFSFGGSVGETGRPGWTEFVDEIGLGWMREDERFKDDPTGRLTTGLGPRARTLRPEYEKDFAKHTASDVVNLVRKHGGAAAEYQDHADVIAHPQAEAVGLVREVRQSGSSLRVTAFPARFSSLETQTLGESPALGASTMEIGGELEFTDVELQEMVDQGGLVDRTRKGGE